MDKEVLEPLIDHANSMVMVEIFNPETSLLRDLDLSPAAIVDWHSQLSWEDRARFWKALSIFLASQLPKDETDDE